MEHDGELILAGEGDTSVPLISEAHSSLFGMSRKNFDFLERYFFRGLTTEEQGLRILQNPDKLGQLISMWDYIPRFVPDNTRVEFDATGVPKLYTRSGRTNSFNYYITLTPALIERKVTPARHRELLAAGIPEEQIKSKERVFVFPGLREDLVEEAIRLLSTEPPLNGPSRLTMTPAGLTLNFTLYEIRKTLQGQQRRSDDPAPGEDTAPPKRKKNSKDMSYEAVREALHVLSGCKIHLKLEAVRGPNRTVYETQTYESSYFSSLQLSQKARKGDQETRCKVSFPPLLVGSIQGKFFRPYRVDLIAQLRTRLARELYRWIHLAHKSAEVGKPIRVSMNQFLADVSSRGVSVIKYDRRRFEEALEDLRQASVIEDFLAEINYAGRGRAIIDIVYMIHLHKLAISDIIGANHYMKGHAPNKNEHLLQLRGASSFTPGSQLPLFFDSPLPAAPTRPRKEPN